MNADIESEIRLGDLRTSKADSLPLIIDVVWVLLQNIEYQQTLLNYRP